MNEQDLMIILTTAALSGMSHEAIRMQGKNSAQIAEWAIDIAQHTLVQMKLKGMFKPVVTQQQQSNNHVNSPEVHHG